ncbi:MAG: DNA mismatch repair endonuclease MutL [Chitinispirillales bacterium]|jgi:DNA mismatch repair protein MutL|nr:DNA mismatch repair endonuclease MutL [Chitinispirillales bacterium]
MQNKNVIEVLPPSVVEKIAAGEVVERPASVLKELVENSIDAGASRIDVAFEEAGFSMMRVSDNGSGMSCANLKRSVLPHATSKIRSADDLYSIATMGFRGEALASISAVSRMHVVTCDGDEDGLAYEINVDGGAHSEAAPASRVRGTTITVRDLFFNVPARKKFMKTARGEHAAIVKIMEQLAIPFPGIHFTVTADGRKLIDLPPVGTLAERISSAAGHEFGRNFVECGGEGDGMSAVIYVSSPDKPQAKKPRYQSLYVNLRRIDNSSVAFAVREAFSLYLGHGNKPAFFCFLDVDPHRVDVNVHPTKQQMKFDDERRVFGFIYHVVKEGLRKSAEALHGLPRTLPVEGARRDYDFDGDSGGIGNIVNTNDINNINNFNNINNNITQKPYSYGVSASGDGLVLDLFNTNFAGGDEGNAVEMGDRRPPELMQCFQIHGIFILVLIKNGILLIDQHAADERIHYEQALRDISGERPASQQLLIPVVLEMSPAEKAILESGGDYFSSMGFEISDFGGTAVSISALPAFLKYGQAEEAVREMVRYLLEGREPGAFSEPAKRFAAAFACGAAIKSGQKLNQEEMNALINALFSTENPHTCPHGRPTISRMSVDELARRFLR